MHMHNTLVLILLLLSCSVYGAADDAAAAQSQSEAETLPPEVRRTLNMHARELQRLLGIWDNEAREFGADAITPYRPLWLSQYLLMYGIDFATDECKQNERRLQEFIEQEQLPLCVPKRYLYHVPGMPFIRSNSNYLVVMEKVEGGNFCIDRNLCAALCKVALGVPHYNLHSASLDKSGDDIAILTTDSIAMPPPAEVALRVKDWLTRGPHLYTGHVDEEGRLSVIFNDPLTVLHRDMLAHFRFDPDAGMYLIHLVRQREVLRKLLAKQKEEPAAPQGQSPQSDDPV